MLDVIHCALFLGYMLSAMCLPSHGHAWCGLPQALFAFGVAVTAFLRHEWAYDCVSALYLFIAAWFFRAWWNNDHNRRRRKKLWAKVKERIAHTSTGKIAVVRT